MKKSVGFAMTYRQTGAWLVYSATTRILNHATAGIQKKVARAEKIKHSLAISSPSS
jgi:hypothetical protein